MVFSDFVLTGEEDGSYYAWVTITTGWIFKKKHRVQLFCPNNSLKWYYLEDGEVYEECGWDLTRYADTELRKFQVSKKLTELKK